MRRQAATTFAGIVILISFAAVGAGSELLNEVDLLNRQLPVTIVTEVGVILPPLTLLELDYPGRIVVEIASGPGTFLLADSTAAARVVSSEGRIVSLPRMVVGPKEGDESFITITVDGGAIGKPIRVGVVAEGGIAKIAAKPELAPAILFIDLDARYVIADMERLVPLASPGSGPASNLTEGGADWCPEDIWLGPLPEDDFPSDEACPGNIQGGEVKWLMGNPGQTGSKFSVKPENLSNVLTWAQAPGQYPIDGIYRFLWGCGIALKVPNGCILTSKPRTGKCCCNPLTSPFGFTCEWLATYTFSDWPDCPLGSPPA